jgi:F420-dependent oxidoreductase-like protein
VAERPLRFGIKVAQMGGVYEEMRDAWLEADRLGFDTAWAHDHVLNQNDISAPEDEGLTALAALLALSKRIRGGLMVGCNTLRHPSLLAKMYTTIDRISGGRVLVGIGAGWFEEEHREYGIELYAAGERIRRLDEACQIMKALWTEPRATVEGRYYQVREAYHEPKPVQKPHPPLVIGGGGEKLTLRVVAKHANEWNFNGKSVDEYRHKAGLLAEHCRAVGRDPSEIEHSAQFQPPAPSDVGEFTDRLRSYVAAGVTHLVITCPQPYSPAGARWLWEEVVPRVRGD